MSLRRQAYEESMSRLAVTASVAARIPIQVQQTEVLVSTLPMMTVPARKISDRREHLLSCVWTVPTWHRRGSSCSLWPASVRNICAKSLSAMPRLWQTRALRESGVCICYINQAVIPSIWSSKMNFFPGIPLIGVLPERANLSCSDIVDVDDGLSIDVSLLFRPGRAKVGSEACVES
jgi:hypothetical protein